MVIVRYPTGKSEFRIVAEAPAVGDVLEQGNDEWHVIDVGNDENNTLLIALGQREGGTTGLGASAAGVPGHPCA
jgi:hypothetical protein